MKKIASFDDFIAEGLTPEEKQEAAEKKAQLDNAAELNRGDEVVIKEQEIHYFKWRKKSESRFKTGKLSKHETRYPKNITVIGINYGNSGAYKQSDGKWSINVHYDVSYTGGRPGRYGWDSDNDTEYVACIHGEYLRKAGEEDHTVKIFDILVKEFAEKVGCKKFKVEKDRSGKPETVSFHKYYVKLETNPSLNMNSYYGHDHSKSGNRGTTRHMDSITLGDFFSKDDALAFAESAKKLYSDANLCVKDMGRKKDFSIIVGPKDDEKYYIMSKEDFISLAKKMLNFEEISHKYRGEVNAKDFGII